MFVTIVVYSTGSLLFINAESIKALYTGAFLLGMNDQLLCILLKIMMNDLFGKQFTHYLPMCFAGFAFSPLVWPLMMSFITNPQNVQRSMSFIEGEKEVLYFDSKIVDNFSTFLKLQLGVHVALLSLVAAFLSKPSKIQSKVSILFQHMVRGEYKRASIIFKESRANVDEKINKLIRNSIKGLPRTSMIQSFSKTIKLLQNPSSRFSTRAPLVDRKNSNIPFKKRGKTFGDPMNHSSEARMIELNEREAMEQSLVINSHVSEIGSHHLNTSLSEKHSASPVKSIDHHEPALKPLTVTDKLASPLFWQIISVCIIRSITSRFFLSSFKIMGLYFFRDDKLINSLGSFAYLGYITVCFSFGRIYDALGLRSSFLLLLGGLMAAHALYAFFTDSLWAYVLISVVQRVRLSVHAGLWQYDELYHHLRNLW